MAAPDFLRKLGARPGDALLVEDADLRAFGAGAKVLSRPPPTGKVRGVVFRPSRREEISEDLRRYRTMIEEDGFIWVVIPRKLAIRELGREVPFEDVLGTALQSDLVDNKTLTFTPQEYGVRLVVRKHLRR